MLFFVKSNLIPLPSNSFFSLSFTHFLSNKHPQNAENRLHLKVSLLIFVKNHYFVKKKWNFQEILNLSQIPKKNSRYLPQ